MVYRVGGWPQARKERRYNVLVIVFFRAYAPQLRSRAFDPRKQPPHMAPRQSTHRMRRGDSRVLAGFTTQRLIFKFDRQVLLVTESCEYRGMRDEPRAQHSLAPGTKIRWTWPSDAEQFLLQLCGRGCTDSRSVSIMVDGRSIGELEWGKPGNGHAAGRAIASTIAKCYDAGLRVTVVGMPAAFKPHEQPDRPASGKRELATSEDQTTETKSQRFTSSKPTPVSAPRLDALRPTPV